MKRPIWILFFLAIAGLLAISVGHAEAGCTFASAALVIAALAPEEKP